MNILIFAGVYYQKDRSRLDNKHEHHSQQASQSSSEDHMSSITGASGPLLSSSTTLDLTKTSLILSAVKSPQSGSPPLSHGLSHISECPPAFADAPRKYSPVVSGLNLGVDSGGQWKGFRPMMPNGSTTQTAMNEESLPCLPPPPRLISTAESQPLLPVAIPLPPRTNMSQYDELRV